MSSISSLFSRPLLIYDDKCSSCARLAMAARRLSGGWIRIAGHYHSKQAGEAKALVFPAGYDPTLMFWLINRKGAYGARSALPQLAKEIAYGMAIRRSSPADSDYQGSCEYSGEMSCFTSVNIAKRIATLLSHGATFRF